MSDVSSKKYAWGIPAGVIITLIAAVATQWATAILMSIYPLAAGWDAARTDEWFTGPVTTFLSVLIFESMAVAVIAAFVVRKRLSFWAVTALARPRWRDLAYTAVGFLAYIGMAVVVLAIVPLLFPIDTSQEQSIGFEPGTGSLALLLAFIGLVVLPPIVEEVVFRGFLYGTLRSNKVNFIWATIVTSLLFSSLHLLGSADGGLLWLAFVDTFVLSIILCYVREQTGSLWASIGVHALKNGLVFLNLFVINASA